MLFSLFGLRPFGSSHPLSRHISIIRVLVHILLVVPVPLLKARKAKVITLTDVSVDWYRDVDVRRTRW